MKTCISIGIFFISPIAHAFVSHKLHRPMFGTTGLTSSAVVLGASTINLDDIENKATQASESWDFFSTPFYTSEDVTLIQRRFEGRSDIACFPIGGSQSPQNRARFVFTNPDLGMDQITADKEYCSILKIENIAGSDSYDPWGNILDSIGVDLENVGDVTIVKDNGETVYLAVVPDVAKTCTRLLPKVLPGAGLTVYVLDREEDEPWIPAGGEIQDMEIKRLDKREQKKR